MYDLTRIKRAHIELTTRCNASCPSCSRNRAGGPVVDGLEMNELTIDDIKRMFPVEIAENLVGINYCGNLGDPGIAKDLLEILEYFKSVNKEGILAQQVRTNGGMRNPDYWAKLGNFFSKQSKPQDSHLFNRGGIVFSVDGLQDTNHIYRRGVKWEKLYANMKAYSDNGGYGNGIWEWLLFEHNQHQVEEAKALADELGFVFVIKTPMGFGEYSGKSTGLSAYDKEGNYEYTIWPANFTGERAEPIFGSKLDFSLFNRPDRVFELSDFSKNLSETSSIVCKSTESHYQEIYVSASGHLLPCCFIGGLFGQHDTTYSRYQLNEAFKRTGLDKFDLRQHSMIDILKGPHFSKFFQDGWSANSVEEGKFLFCVETCGEISAVDKLYKREQLFDPNYLNKIIPITPV